MKFWNNLKICGAYFIYLFIFLWMFAKEFLGYQVDWSWCPPFTPAGRYQEKQEINSHSSNPKVRHGIYEKSKDLEANLKSAHSASSSVLEDSEKVMDRKKPNDACHTNYSVIYEAHPINMKKATHAIVTDRELVSQALSLSPLPSEPGSQRTLSKAEYSPDVTPTVTRSDGKNGSHINSKLDGFITKALRDALHEHQQLEDATTNRLNFVKGLKYMENHSFRFPAILSALRTKPIKSRHAPKGDKLTNLPLFDTIPPITSTCPSAKPEAPSIMTNAPIISELEQTSPTPGKSPSPYPPPPSPVQTSTSSASSYSSTYTIIESSYIDPVTPADEDIPINFTCSLPSWRRDPDRAKFMFGSLARSIVDSNDGSKSEAGVVNEDESCLVSIADSKAEGERVSPTEDVIISRHQVAIAEESSALKNSRLESMILAMGLDSPPTASILCSGSGTTEDEDESQTKVQPTSEQCNGLDTGLAASLVSTAKGRELIMSDLLSWVESSSPGCQ